VGIIKSDDHAIISDNYHHFLTIPFLEEEQIGKYKGLHLIFKHLFHCSLSLLLLVTDFLLSSR